MRVLANFSQDLAGCRYAEILDALLERLGAVQVLRASWEGYYQGDVDVDVLLADGRVFSYHYYYGSCSVCDEWERRFGWENDMSKQVAACMEQEATFFDNRALYDAWRASCPKE